MSIQFKYMQTIVVAALAITACSGNSDKAVSRPDNTTIAHESRNISALEFNADSAYSYVGRQVAMGPRIPGSDAHKECEQFISRFMLESGADTVSTQRGTMLAADCPLRHQAVGRCRYRQVEPQQTSAWSQRRGQRRGRTSRNSTSDWAKTPRDRCRLPVYRCRRHGRVRRIGSRGLMVPGDTDVGGPNAIYGGKPPGIRNTARHGRPPRRGFQARIRIRHICPGCQQPRMGRCQSIGIREQVRRRPRRCRYRRPHIHKPGRNPVHRHC